MKKIRATVLLVFWFLLFTNCADKTTEQSTMERPNIIWFVSEDNSPFLGAYGNTVVETPTFDAFAAEGITYTNAFANAPVCAPSRSGIITGVYPPAMGSQHMRSNVSIAEHINFFPKYLKDAGYFTSLRIKRDYNIPKQEGTWDIDDWWNIPDAFKGREDNQPYFMMYNTWMTHEGKIHGRENGPNYFKATFSALDSLVVEKMFSSVKKINPNKVVVPPYMPDLPEVRDDLAYYHELMQMLDMEFKHVLDQLEASGELENTIVIYSSDHGGVLGRSKRFTFESGLQIPLIVKYPKKWQHLAPVKAGGTSDKLVSLIDIAPTVLALAGVAKPEHLSGHNFLGKDDYNYAYGFRGRMDESYDMVRTLRNKKYRYIRNYYPHRPAAQHINYLWEAKNVQAWEAAYHKNALDSTAQLFFLPKPTEELYLIEDDTSNTNNLIENAEHNAVLEDFRTAMDSVLLTTMDTGFIPEGALWAGSKSTNLNYADYVKTLPFKKIYKAANTATKGIKTEELITLTKDTDANVRFWGTVGILVNLSRAQQIGELKKYEDELIQLSKDQAGDVAVNASEILYLLGQEDFAITNLTKLLLDENPFVSLRATNAIEALNFETFPKSIQQSLEKLSKMDEKGSHQYAIRKAKYFLGIRAY